MIKYVWNLPLNTTLVGPFPWSEPPTRPGVYYTQDTPELASPALDGMFRKWADWWHFGSPWVDLAAEETDKTLRTQGYWWGPPGGRMIYLCDGWVTSVNDGDAHYITVEQLAGLYGLGLGEYRVFKPGTLYAEGEDEVWGPCYLPEQYQKRREIARKRREQGLL